MKLISTRTDQMVSNLINLKRVVYSQLTVGLMVLCSLATNSLAQEQRPSPIDQRVADLEKRVAAMESIPGVAMALKLISPSLDNAPGLKPTPTPQQNAPLEVASWSYSFEKGKNEYENRHLFKYSLKNRTQRSIKLVDGILVFRDLLGEKIMGIKLDRDVTYPVGEVTEAGGAWRVNTFETSEMRLLTIKREDVKAELVINAVVFDDNSTWSASQK